MRVWGGVGIGTSIAQGGLVIMNGNVGIGSIAPDYPLRVVNSDPSSVSIVANGSIVSAGGPMQALAYIDQSNGGYYLDPAGDSVGSNYSMVVAKNVGINSTAPGRELDVQGTIRVSKGLHAVGIGTTSVSILCIDTSGRIGRLNGVGGTCTAL